MYILAVINQAKLNKFSFDYAYNVDLAGSDLKGNGVAIFNVLDFCNILPLYTFEVKMYYITILQILHYNVVKISIKNIIIRKPRV